MSNNPEIGQFVRTGPFRTNYHDLGEGAPICFLHGSGPGVSAYANWRLVFERLASTHRLVAPDFAGFGFTEVPEGTSYGLDVWLEQLVAFLDAIGVEKTSVVGNSFGGSMALALAIRHPERVEKLILMGAVGVDFEITEGLDAVWGYEPSEELMGRLMRETFAYDGSFITDDLIRSRYEASLRPGAQEAFSSMFPAPRQRWVDSMAHPEEDIRGISAPTLIVHGRDDKVIPFSNSLRLHELVEDSTLHSFGRCGHWTQIEKVDPFCRLVADFVGR